MYMCFDGVKKGFLSACRAWFGVDGTFLKGPGCGTLLTAVGPDLNNGVYPIAYAVVEGENFESWAWFLRLLRADLEIINDHVWSVMSDKQKGLISACKEVFPNAVHKYCVKHLHDNMVYAGYRGVELKRALWAAAKCTTHAQYIACINHLHEVNSEGGVWLADKPPEEWSRSHFSTHTKCDLLPNNLCESFNSKILEARKKPILTMFESLRLYMMEKMQVNRTKARTKWNNSAICPRIFQRMKSLCISASKCVPRASTDHRWDVLCCYENMYYDVDTNKRNCGCRKWQLTGIPCVHGIAALWAAELNPLDYVEDWYSVETYLRCYEHCIYPINGPKEWVKTVNIALKPARYSTKKKGRPSTKRRVSHVEIAEGKNKGKKVKRTRSKTKCGFCGEIGHNQVSCLDKKRYEAGLKMAELQGFQPRPVFEPQNVPETNDDVDETSVAEEMFHELHDFHNVLDQSIQKPERTVEVVHKTPTFTKIFGIHPTTFFIGEKIDLVNKRGPIGASDSGVANDRFDMCSSTPAAPNILPISKNARKKDKAQTKEMKTKSSNVRIYVKKKDRPSSVINSKTGTAPKRLGESSLHSTIQD